MEDRTVHSVVRELRAVAEALAAQPDGPPDTLADGFTRIRDLAGQGLRLLDRDPSDPTATDRATADAAVSRTNHPPAAGIPFPDPASPWVHTGTLAPGVDVYTAPDVHHTPTPGGPPCPFPGPHQPGSTPHCPTPAGYGRCAACGNQYDPAVGHHCPARARPIPPTQPDPQPIDRYGVDPTAYDPA